MSYRSLKRVLGESSLERKCRWLFGVSLLVLITGSFWWYGRSTERLVLESTRESARGLVDTSMMIHHWKKDQEGSDNESGGEKERAGAEHTTGWCVERYLFGLSRPAGLR